MGLINNINNSIKRFISKDKIKNSLILLIIAAIVFILGAFLINKGIYTLVNRPGYTLKSFFLSKNDTYRMLGISVMGLLYMAFLFNLIFGGKSSTNNLGNAELGSVRNLDGLTGNDGLALSKKVRLSSKACFEHIAVIGPTGAGKSTSFFIPNLLSLPPNASMVISDPKGELYQKTAAYNQSIGRKCILFSPLEPQYGLKYNPLEMANSVTEVREMAQNLLINGANAVALATGKQGGGDSEWINMSVPLWAAALIFCKQQGGKLGNIGAALDLLLEKDSKQLDLIFGHSTPEVKAQYNIYKQAAGSDKTASSIKTVLSSNLQLFTDPNIRFVSDTSEFNPYDLKDEPIAIYIMCPERKSSYASPFMSVFYTQVINKLMEYKGKDLPVYMMLDEFANIGVIPNFAQLAATCRSRKLSLSIGIQGIEQLWQNYGKETGDNILNNMKSKMFYPSLAYTTAEIASKLCGYTTITTESTSKGKDKDSHSTSTSYQRRELLDPDEIRRLPEDELLLVLHNRAPIIDKKNTYYTDKILTKRENMINLPVRDDYTVVNSGFRNPLDTRQLDG